LNQSGLITSHWFISRGNSCLDKKTIDSLDVLRAAYIERGSVFGLEGGYHVSGEEGGGVEIGEDVGELNGGSGTAFFEEEFGGGCSCCCSDGGS
jgi:hypothetical protein